MKEYRKKTMKHYCVEKLMCCCNTCKNEFVDIIPFGYELICFDMASGEKVFLPTYGENGYLDLLKKLVPEWNDSKEISFKVSKLFEERINNYTPYKVSYHNKTECMFLSINRWRDSYHIKNLVFKCHYGQFYSLAA